MWITYEIRVQDLICLRLSCFTVLKQTYTRLLVSIFEIFNRAIFFFVLFNYIAILAELHGRFGICVSGSRGGDISQLQAFSLLRPLRSLSPRLSTMHSSQISPFSLIFNHFHNLFSSLPL